MTGHRAGREDERARRVQGECARNCFGRHVPDGSQMPVPASTANPAMLLCPRLAT
jgi:hypothetical protein